MRIGVDARPLQNNNRFRGIGRYLENVLKGLSKLSKDDTFVFFVEKGSPMPQDVFNLFKRYETRLIPGSKIKRVKYVRALARPQVRVQVKPGDVDVFFQADPWNGIPKNVPTAAAFHDLIPLLFKLEIENMGLKGIKKYKQLFGDRVQGKFYKEMLGSYKAAKAMVAISQSSKNDYIKYIDSSAKNIYVTPLAGSENSFPKVTAALRTDVRKKYDLGDSPFILYVGGIDLRKNIARLAKDFFELKKNYKNLKMLVVGKEFGLKRDLKMVGWTSVLEKHPKEARDILIPGFVPDDELGALYAEAIAFVFPSLYEGFGLPILEAMHQGCPVIAYSNSSIPEVAGDAAILVESDQPLAPSVERLLNDQKLRAALIAKGKKQVTKFTWEKAAGETYKVLKGAARRE